MPNDQSWNTVAASPAERVAQNINLTAKYRPLPAPEISQVADSSTSITISLTTPSDSDATYTLQCSIDGGPYVAVAENLSAASFPYKRENLAAGSYRHQLKAVNQYMGTGFFAVQAAVTLEGGGGGTPGDPVSGGISTLSWSAPEGLADGNELVVETDGTDGGFGIHGLEYASLGFGQGWLYSAELEEPMPTAVTDPTSGKALNYSTSYTAGEKRRFAREEDGLRYLHARLRRSEVSNASAANSNAGFIYYDMARRQQPNEWVFISSYARMKADTWWEGAQIKAERIRYNLSEPYLYQSPRIGYPSGSMGQRVLTTYAYSRSGVMTKYHGDAPHPHLDYKWCRHDFCFNGGTPGQPDGQVVSRGISRHRSIGLGVESSSDVFFSEEDPANERPQYLCFQDYTDGNFNSEPGPTGSGEVSNMHVDRTDIFMQVGTLKRFELADTDNPATMTESLILLPKTWAAQQVSLHLWSGLLESGFSSKYLHYYNDNGEFVRSVPLF